MWLITGLIIGVVVGAWIKDRKSWLDFLDTAFAFLNFCSFERLVLVKTNFCFSNLFAVDAIVVIVHLDFITCLN